MSRSLSKGYFRYLNRFQIVPPHDSFPTETLSNEHPLILQIACDNNGDPLHEYTKWVRILNLFIRGGMMPISNWKQYIWSSWDKTRGSHLPEWVDAEYFVALTEQVKGFDSTSGIEPVPIITDDQYYGVLGWHFRSCPDAMVGGELSIPSSLPARLKQVEDLEKAKPKLYERFIRACAWVEIANKVSYELQTLKMIALVIAVESLLENSQLVECPHCLESLICQSCKKLVSRPGLSKKFHTFMSKYAGKSGNEAHKEFIKNIYPLRGRAVHSGRLLQSELMPYGDLIEDFKHDKKELNNLANLSEGVRVAIVNWLTDANNPH